MLTSTLYEKRSSVFDTPSSVSSKWLCLTKWGDEEDHEISPEDQAIIAQPVSESHPGCFRVFTSRIQASFLTLFLCSLHLEVCCCSHPLGSPLSWIDMSPISF